MPNYRNKNRSRNKNKQRIKQQQQQKQQSQQPQQQQQKLKAELCKEECDEPLAALITAPTIKSGRKPQTLPHSTANQLVADDSDTSLQKHVTNFNTSATDKINELCVCESVQTLKEVADLNITTAAGTETTGTTDTVLNVPSQCENRIENKHAVQESDNMGNEKSKISDNQQKCIRAPSAQPTTNASTIAPSTSVLGKVIVHRVICEDSNALNANNETTTTRTKELTPNESKLDDNSAAQSFLNNERDTNKEQQQRVIVHKTAGQEDNIQPRITSRTDPRQQKKNNQVNSESTTNDNKILNRDVKIIGMDTENGEGTKPEENSSEKPYDNPVSSSNFAKYEKDSTAHEMKIPSNNAKFVSESNETPKIQQQTKVIVHHIYIEDKDEEPKITSPTMREPLTSLAKPTTSEVSIVEISDESFSDLEELRSPIVSEAESSIEYSDEAQQVPNSIKDLSMSSSTSTAGNQRQTRKQKRMALENHFLPQMLNPRFLDSISEENSELSDNSENPLSRSASTDSTTNCPTEGKVQKLNAKYPKSSLDFSKSYKQQSNLNRKSKIIREEPVAVAVAARLQDAPNADECCSRVRSCMSPEAEAAEVVFINSASSSMSDLRDIELSENPCAIAQETKIDNELTYIQEKPVTQNICFELLTSSASPTPLASAFTAKIPQHHLPEVCENLSNNYKNNQIINNSKLLNNNTSHTPHTPATTISDTKTRSLAETNTCSESDLHLLSSGKSSPANDQLVFAQIEEQILSVLSSINEVASQNSATSAATTSLSSLSSPSKTFTSLSNTQKLPITTTPTNFCSTTLKTSCEDSSNGSSSSSCSSLIAVNNANTSRNFSTNANMNTVRDIITNNNGNDKTLKLNGNHEASDASGYVKLNYNSSNTFTPIPSPRGSPSPPPVPPPSQEHQRKPMQDECDNTSASVVASSYSAFPFTVPLLQKNIGYHNLQTLPHHNPPKSLISQTSPLTSCVTRQKSMDSHCSDSSNLSQCTAINVATAQTDKSDTVPTSSISDLKSYATHQNHSSDNNLISAEDPKKLRTLCAETLASFPYGNAVLEELATVAQSIGEARAFQAAQSETKMPYPPPELPHIDDLQLSLEVGSKFASKKPEPLQQEQSWLGVPTNNDPKILVCLSPSQRSYIQQAPEPKPDDLLDAHQKFVERRGYHEYTKEQLLHLEKEKLAEQQLLQTAAVMKKLRKSITPPPPQVPPPPVPVKSSETASKAQNLSKRTATNTKITQTKIPNHDVSMMNDNKQTLTASSVEQNGEESKHRLLSIIQDTNESNSNKQKHSAVSSSSSSSSPLYENNPRQTISGVNAPVKEQAPTAPSALSNGSSDCSQQFIHQSNQKATGNMQGVEPTLGQMFPTIGSSDIFDREHKRFSNIESTNSEPFCNQIVSTQPKRYSSIETHIYEAQKRIENGKVIDDFSTSKHETKTTGEKPKDLNTFPLKSAFPQESNSFLRLDKELDVPANHRNNQEIMSALNLNKHSSDSESKQQQIGKTQSEITIKTTTMETSQYNSNCENQNAKTDEKHFSKTQGTENFIPKRGAQDTYEEFRQRAKAAADAASTLPSLNSRATATAAAATTTQATANSNESGKTILSTISSEEATSTKATTEHHETTIRSHDPEKLFKEFDDLSKQLHRELETSKTEKAQREKSTSMFDLNRIHLRQKQQIEEFNRRRHEHFKELEQEIERSMKSRSLKFARPQQPAEDTVEHHQTGRTYEIPIHIENGNTTVPAATPSGKSTSAGDEPPPVPKYPKTYQIPIQIENSETSCLDNAKFRRAESMFNLSDDTHQGQRCYGTQMQFQNSEDDWSRYASDLGSSENIARPFAKEVEICYQRRPGGIRAPRLTASTSDLSFNNQHFYDQFNSYNVKKHHAPMMNTAPEKGRPTFGSCYSMIERDPNPKYISTTTRRGVSPAPQTNGFFPLDRCHVKEEDMRQRRSSLPRELHEQQLKYIASKEEELRMEFERLQTERRRLMEEAQRAQAVHVATAPNSANTPTRPLRDHYRVAQKLPTLSEDEVFRQQMAEEWLSKVAEREQRRLQNIIKISKVHKDEASSKHKTGMEEEFLNRVKERRHKLAMPADSDWESGAESQPILQAQHSESEDMPPVTVIEGEKEANLRRLPRHLREFAKFSNHQKENIEGGHREEHREEERTEETTDNSVSRAYKKSSLVKTVKTLHDPMLPENHGHEIDNGLNTSNDGDHDFGVFTSNSNTYPNFSTNFPNSSVYITEFPRSIDEMFGKSPFRSRIFEEFNNYWRHFYETNNNF